MMRLFAIGCGFVWGGLAFAQGPVSVYPTRQTQPMQPPAQTQQMPPHTQYQQYQPAPGVNQPLPHLVASGVPAPGGCTTGCTPYAACPYHRQRAGRPCLQRIWGWLTHQPCPRVLPVLNPTPYQAPLRQYFPCTPSHGHGAVPGCRTGLLPRLHGAPGACSGCPAPRVSLVSRLMRFFDPRPHPYDYATWAGGACAGGTGDCPCPPAGAYRYASPCVVPPPSSPYLYQGGAPNATYPVQGVTPTTPYQPQGVQKAPAPALPASSRPFTTP